MSQPDLAPLLSARDEGRLVVFIGAGVSTLPPTCLPSWWQINREVVTAILDVSDDLVTGSSPKTLADAILKRQDSGHLPHEYQAELLASRLSGDKYFKVLQCLDGDRPNEVHLALAALAKAGKVQAVVTTNFDRVLEKAFQKVEANFQVLSHPDHFDEASQNLASLGEKGCPILKIHGSAEDPSTLIDTLAQRNVGFSPSKSACLRHLLDQGHWLFMGYSGADLEANPNYLSLRSQIKTAQGFTWLFRTGDEPLTVIDRLARDYGDRGRIVYGTLPEWIIQITGDLKVPPPEGIDVGEARREAELAVKEHTLAWAKELGSHRCGIFLSELADDGFIGREKWEFLWLLYDLTPQEDRTKKPFAYVCHALALAEQEAGEYDKALEHLAESYRILEVEKDALQAAKILSEIGDVHRERGELGEALARYKRAHEVIQREGEDKDQPAILNDLATVHFDRAEYDEAQAMYLKELEYYKKLGDEVGQGTIYNYLGGVHYYRNQYGLAEENFRKALAIFERIGEEDHKAGCLNNMGNIQYSEGNYDQAENLWHQARLLYQQLGKTQSVSHLTNNLAIIHQKKGDLVKAGEMLVELLQLFEGQGDLAGQAKTLGNLANLSRAEGRYDEAEERYQGCLALFEQMENRGAAAPWYREWATLYREQEDWEQAAKYERVSYEIAVSINDFDDAGDNAFNLALYFELMSDYQTAEDWAEKAAEFYNLDGQSRKAEEALTMAAKYDARAEGKGCLALILGALTLGWMGI